MFFDREDNPASSRKPTWWDVAAVALAIVVLAASLAYAF